MYNLPTNGKTPEEKITVILQAKLLAVKQMLERQEAIIVALTKGAGTALFIEKDEEVPKGCGTEVVSADVTVHIPVQVSYIFHGAGVLVADDSGQSRRCGRDQQARKESRADRVQ